jgi:hypothetical protein
LQWIDYCAVDCAHNDNKLLLEIMHTYAEPGEYTIIVKVIDILASDTTKTVKAKVG